MLGVAVAILALSIAEAVMTVAVPSPGGGANIGFSLVALGSLLSAASVGMAVISGRLPAESRVGSAARAGVVVALLVASVFRLVVGLGILEELR